MKGRKIEEMGVSSRGMYMRNIAGITQKWKDIRIADIIPNGSYLCSNADILKLSEIAGGEILVQFATCVILLHDENNDRLTLIK